MAFPSASGTVQDNLSDAWERARNYAGRIKQTATALRNQSAAGNIQASIIIDFSNFVADAKVQLQRSASVSGIASYAQSQIGNGSFDVAGAFNSMMTEIDNTVAWIISNFPKDSGTGYLLFLSLDSAGKSSYRTLTSTQTAGLRTALDALIATID